MSCYRIIYEYIDSYAWLEKAKLTTPGKGCNNTCNADTVVVSISIPEVLIIINSSLKKKSEFHQFLINGNRII